MRTLLVGASGQLGGALKAMFSTPQWPSPGFENHYFYPTRAELDITNTDAINAYVERWKPDLIINCAAWTDVDECERDRDRAYAVNALGAENLAMAAQEVGAKMIQVSSDYCRDEMPLRDPAGVYASSKYSGEQKAWAAWGTNVCILRLSCLLSTDPRGWLSSAIRKAICGEPIHVAAQVTYPTTVETAVGAILGLAQNWRSGVWCAAGAPSISRHALALEAIRCAGTPEGFQNASIDLWERGPSLMKQIQEIPPDTPNIAPRPVDSRMAGPWLYRGEWRAWLELHAPEIAKRERQASHV